MNINRNKVVSFVILPAALIGLGIFAGIGDREGWFDRFSFTPANEEAVWLCRTLEDAQGESLLIVLLDLKGGMKARGWMDADGSVTPKGEASRTAAMERCPDLYFARFPNAEGKLVEPTGTAAPPPERVTETPAAKTSGFTYEITGVSSGDGIINSHRDIKGAWWLIDVDVTNQSDRELAFSTGSQIVVGSDRVKYRVSWTDGAGVNQANSLRQDIAPGQTISFTVPVEMPIGVTPKSLNAFGDDTLTTVELPS